MTYRASGWRSTIAGMAAIATSMPLPGEISPKVASTVRPAWARAASGPLPLPLPLAFVDPAAPGSSCTGPPWGTTRTRSGRTSRASMTMRRAVSVKTHTSVASSQSARSVSAWWTEGADSTVCRVMTRGWCSSRARLSTCSPSAPPKMPYSCWTTTTSSPRRSITRAAAA